MLCKSDTDKEHVYKILLVGTSGVGKSSILSRVLRGNLPPKPVPTIGVEFSTKIFTSNQGDKIRGQIWDTGCLNKYRRVVTAHFKKTHGALCIFDICNQDSFESIKSCLDDLRKYGDPEMVIMMVGNKYDLCDGTSISREVSYSEVLRYSEKNGILYEDVSALKDFHVDSAIHILINEIHNTKTGIQKYPQMKVPSSLMDEFHCGICRDYVSNAVETACCHNLACEECFTIQAQCPWCGSSEVRYSPSFPIRRIVSNLPTHCTECDLAIKRGEITHHITVCPKRKITCLFCFSIFSKDVISKHLYQYHEEEVLSTLLGLEQTKLLLTLNSKGMLSNDGVLLQSNTSNTPENLIGVKINLNGTQARLGGNGKYYCSSKNNTCKECCEGVCGPFEGCNCWECMSLDVKNRKLSREYMVNREGRICRRYDNGSVFCGCRVICLDSDRVECSLDNGMNCEACQKIQKQWDVIYAQVHKI